MNYVIYFIYLRTKLIDFCFLNYLSFNYKSKLQFSLNSWFLVMVPFSWLGFNRLIFHFMVPSFILSHSLFHLLIKRKKQKEK